MIRSMGGYNLDYKKRLDRISELSLKAQELELTTDELRERDILRREYATTTKNTWYTHDKEYIQLTPKN